jgi:hypothetical protein
MTWVSNTIIAIGAIALLTLGGVLALQDKTATAGAILGFGFLLVVLLLLAKFKRFKGFGFEAELWDQKQVEAAALVDKLTALATLASEQVALISAKRGMWDAGLSNAAGRPNEAGRRGTRRERRSETPNRRDVGSH